MAVADLMIHFQYSDDDDIYRNNKQFYLPGEEMKGVVSLHLNGYQRVKGLTLHILGTGTVSWESPAKKKVYQSSEIYLESAKPLLDLGYDNSIEFPPGLHQFGFRFLLPSDLPSTFNGVYGQVTYLAKVKMDSEDERNATLTSEPFLVLRRPELPVELFEEKTVKKSRFFFSLNSGKVKLRCTLDKSAAIPGDNIIINAEMTNTTDKDVTLIQAALILESHYFAEKHEIVFRHGGEQQQQ